MLLAHSPHTLNTFCILLETLKEQYFERSNWGYILAQDEQVTNFIFWLSLKKMLFADMENVHNYKKRRKTQHISVHNGPT
jgi:hypothetical protein